MNRQSIIVFIQGERIECWGNFKKLCEAKQLPYHSLKAKKFPIQYGVYIIHRVEFK